MSKPVTLEDGSLALSRFVDTYYRPHRFGDAPAWYNACERACADLLEARAREKRLRDALEAIKYALSDERPLGVPGWKPARDYLDARDIYHDDLNDLRVLFEVARAALNDKEEGQ